jgi:tRNA pseudouridine13 synthase
LTDSFSLPEWHYAYGSPSATGFIKTYCDVVVGEEQLPFEPDGTGEHAFIQIEKRGENTEYVARALARIAGVRQRDIGFAGLKDRQARTTQWFSIWLPGKKNPDWAALETETISVLQSTRHRRKLKRGVLQGNQFTLIVRHFSGDRVRCEQQLEKIKHEGCPNYFGHQRFGLQGKNITTALALFEGAQTIKRQQRGIYLSAARGYIFNEILSDRVQKKLWNHAVEEDLLMFTDSNSYFKAKILDEHTLRRVQNATLHPTGCLYGKGETLAIEASIIAKQTKLSAGLLKFGLEADRRVLRVMPQNVEWQFLNPQQLQLRFFLPAGSYATVLLREIINFQT